MNTGGIQHRINTGEIQHRINTGGIQYRMNTGEIQHCMNNSEMYGKGLANKFISLQVSILMRYTFVRIDRVAIFSYFYISNNSTLYLYYYILFLLELKRYKATDPLMNQGSHLTMVDLLNGLPSSSSTLILFSI